MLFWRYQDNTEYAFLQMDDRVLVYRGADQPDKSVINPESDVWQHIKVSSHTFMSFTQIILSADPRELSRSKLANSIFFHQCRWEIGRCCWKTGPCSLQ